MGLDKVCAIIDMDGFAVHVSSNGGVTFKNEFLIRELSYVQIHPDADVQPKSYLFNLRKFDFKKCQKNDMKTINYQVKRVLGLPLYSSPNENAVDYDSSFEIVKNMYADCKVGERDIVAYKGGNNEKQFLDKLDIPSLNLERYGCPRYEDLVKSLSHSKLKSCGHHSLVNSKSGLVHCPLAEVIAFKDWFMMNCDFGKQGKEEEGGPCGPCEKHSSASSSAHLSSEEYTSSDSD